MHNKYENKLVIIACSFAAWLICVALGMIGGLLVSPILPGGQIPWMLGGLVIGSAIWGSARKKHSGPELLKQLNPFKKLDD